MHRGVSAGGTFHIDAAIVLPDNAQGRRVMCAYPFSYGRKALIYFLPCFTISARRAVARDGTKSAHPARAVADAGRL